MGQNKHSRPGVRHTPPARLPSDIIFLGVRARAISSTSSFLQLQPSRGGRGGGLPIVGFLNCGPTCKANSNARPQTDLSFAWILRLGRAMGSCLGHFWHAVAVRRTRGRISAAYIFLCKHISFIIDFFGTWKYITKILTRKARPKKTRTTRIHFRRYPTSITAHVSWISAFSMHSLLICGGSILRASFFFECKEVDVASSHLVSCLASILVLPPVCFSLRLSSNTHTKLEYQQVH